MSLIADSLDRMIVNTILVAVDGSPASLRAARAAVGFAHDHVAKVIVLAFVQGLSHSDLASRLATPLGTVKSWIRRGLAALRSCLEA